MENNQPYRKSACEDNKKMRSLKNELKLYAYFFAFFLVLVVVGAVFFELFFGPRLRGFEVVLTFRRLTACSSGLSLRCW